MADLKYVTIKGTRVSYLTVGQRLPKGYLRISTKSKLHELAKAKLGVQGHQAVYYHISVCTLAHGRPPGLIGIGPNRYTVDHKNGISTDNRPCNLRWMLHSENTALGNSNRNK